MLKQVTFLFATMVLVSGSAKAGDLMDELSTASVDSIASADIAIEEFDLDGVDVDGLSAEAGEETDAIEACFRRFGGYRSCGWRGWGGYSGYGYRSFGHCYNYCQPYYCHRPIVRCYSYCAPVITHYWGCY
ncbi:hypothetical protein [Botrimarina sp.]|uniref:hypothetical protein n=1 Tax=Botrimarina sp. TaxID=2795802 RepID=UPI0032F00201